MKLINSALIILGLMYAMIMTIYAIDLKVRSLQYEHAFEGARGTLESYVREHGIKADPSFVCYKRKL